LIKRATTSLAILLLVCQVSYSQLIGYFPEGGGAMSVETTDGPIQTPGLNFDADPGILTIGDDPAPFDFFLGNNLDNVAFAALRQVTPLVFSHKAQVQNHLISSNLTTLPPAR